MAEALKADPSIVELNWLNRSIGVDNFEPFRARHELIPKYSFAIPTEAALALIAKHGPIVEIGAGTGYWALLLAERGVDIVAYDIEPGHSSFHAHDPWFPVVKDDHTRVADHQERTLFLCWPYMDDMAYQALGLYQGQTVIYIGEGRGGCCANDEFFSTLADDWEAVEEVEIPQWWGVHDYLTVYRRAQKGN